MLQLAVSSRAETFERLKQPLAKRDIAVKHFDVEGRLIPLEDQAAPWTAESFDAGYIFPSRGMEGAAATELAEISWINDRASVLRSRNKAGVLARLAKEEIQVPRSTLVSNPIDRGELRSVWADFNGQVVIKPNSTTRGVGIARAHDLDSFLGIVDYLSAIHEFRPTADKSFLVQEFIPEATDIRAMVLDGQYVGAVERRLPAEARSQDRWKHNVHLGATATATELSPKQQDLVERVAESVSIPILGVDLLVTPERTVVTETNARPTIDRAEKYDPGFFDRLAGLVRDVATAE